MPAEDLRVLHGIDDELHERVFRALEAADLVELRLQRLGVHEACGEQPLLLLVQLQVLHPLPPLPVRGARAARREQPLPPQLLGRLHGLFLRRGAEPFIHYFLRQPQKLEHAKEEEDLLDPAAAGEVRHAPRRAPQGRVRRAKTKRVVQPHELPLGHAARGL